MNTPVDTSAINEDATRTGDDSSHQLRKLVDSLEKVDLLIADLGQLSNFNSQATTFVKEAEKEIRWNRIARVWVLIAAAVVVALLLIAGCLILISHPFEKVRDNPPALATIIAAVIGGSVFICIGIARAVFSSFPDRNAGVPVPEQLKAVIDTFNTLFSRH